MQSQVYQIRLEPGDRDLFDAAAKSAGLNLATWVRRACLMASILEKGENRDRVEAIKAACDDAAKRVEAGAPLMVPQPAPAFQTTVPGFGPPAAPRVNVKAAMAGIVRPRKLAPEEMCERCRGIGTPSCEKCVKKSLEAE